MADEKIKISWDEVNSPQVDALVNQQNAAARLHQHYQQQAAPTAQPTRSAKASIWYNTLFYMTLFGLLGGGTGWLLSEVVWHFAPSALEEFRECSRSINYANQQVQRGEISSAQGDAMLDQLASRYKDNPFIAIYLNNGLSETEKQHQVDALLEKEGFREFVHQLIWFSTLGMVIAFALTVAESVVSRNPRGIVIHGSVGAALGLVGGIIVGLFINKLYRALGGGVSEGVLDAKQIMARTVGWGVLGLFSRSGLAWR